MPDAFRKTRSDSTLAGLDPALLAELDEHAQTHTLEETRTWLEQDRAVKVSAGALSNHLRKRRLTAFKGRMMEASATATDLATEAARLNDGKADDALFAALRVRIMDLMAESNASPKDIRALLQLIIAARKTDHDARKIALLEKKAQLLDDLENKAKGGTAITATTIAEMQRLAGLL